MIDIFDYKELDISKMVCHSGGAIGSDQYFEKICEKYNIKVNAYSYKTEKHKSKNKVEISDDDYKEGVSEINKANKWLNRFGIHKYMNFLARNWTQVKYSDEIFAIGYIIEPGKKGKKGYYNKSKLQVVDGGTGYAVQMGINNDKLIHVFDQNLNNWFRWSPLSNKFIKVENEIKIVYHNFAGIGTRDLKKNGSEAIKKLFKNTI